MLHINQTSIRDEILVECVQDVHVSWKSFLSLCV